MFDIFAVAIGGIVMLGIYVFLRRPTVSRQHPELKIGIGAGLALGTLTGLVLSYRAGTFALILPVSMGLGIMAGLIAAWVFQTVRASLSGN